MAREGALEVLDPDPTLLENRLASQLRVGGDDPIKAEVANDVMDATASVKAATAWITLEEKRKADAIAAGKADLASTGGKLAKDNFTLSVKVPWYKKFFG